MKQDIYIFDCDGVILDSNTIKSEAFRQTLADYPVAEVDSFISYHTTNGGISRFLKFEYFLTHITKQPKHTSDELLNIFGNICLKNLISSNLIKGVEEFLKNANDKGITCYVNSGGEEKELRTIFKQKNLTKYFKYIYGSPSTKQENMQRILQDLNQDNFTNTVFFGDSKTDVDTAINNNCNVIFISGVSEYKDWENDKNITTEYKDFIKI